jgi:hypothetical protein
MSLLTLQKVLEIPALFAHVFLNLRQAPCHQSAQDWIEQPSNERQRRAHFELRGKASTVASGFEDERPANPATRVAQ